MKHTRHRLYSRWTRFIARKRALSRSYSPLILIRFKTLKVLNALQKLGVSEESVRDWAAEVNTEGLEACEALLSNVDGPYCFGAAPTLADICLVPQLGNARRFGVDVRRFPRLIEAEAACLQLQAFAEAVPDRQPNSE